MKKNLIIIFLTVTVFVAVTSTHSKTGYFMHAYDLKAKDMAGTSTSYFQDSLTIATNPAGLNWVSQRVDMNAAVFTSDRSNISIGQYDMNGREYFIYSNSVYIMK